MSRLVVAVAMLATAYGAGFLLIRKAIGVDYFGIDSRRRGTSLIVYYFSKDQRTNDVLYYLYYPLHWVLGRGDERVMDQVEREERVPHNTPIYVRDLSYLRARELVGFERRRAAPVPRKAAP
jgi:hypothetical protein